MMLFCHSFLVFIQKALRRSILWNVLTSQLVLQMSSVFGSVVESSRNAPVNVGSTFNAYAGFYF